MDSYRRQLLGILSLDFISLICISLSTLSALVTELEYIRMFTIFILPFFGLKLIVQDGPFSMLQEVSPFHIDNIRNTLQKRNLIWTLIFAVSTFAFVFEVYIVMSPLDIEIVRKIFAITMLVMAVYVAARIYIVTLKLTNN